MPLYALLFRPFSPSYYSCQSFLLVEVLRLLPNTSSSSQSLIFLPNISFSPRSLIILLPISILTPGSLPRVRYISVFWHHHTPPPPYSCFTPVFNIFTTQVSQLNVYKNSLTLFLTFQSPSCNFNFWTTVGSLRLSPFWLHNNFSRTRPLNNHTKWHISQMGMPTGCYPRD